MSSIPDDILVRAQKYCDRKGIGIEQLIGSGQDGSVFRTDRMTAIKTFRYPKQFQRELQVYERLYQYKVFSVEGFTVPKFLDLHREFLVIEMQVVEPPFVLDFAGAESIILPARAYHPRMDRVPPRGEWLFIRRNARCAGPGESNMLYSQEELEYWEEVFQRDFGDARSFNRVVNGSEQ